MIPFPAGVPPAPPIVRDGATRRVASAVGEGAMAIQFVHAFFEALDSEPEHHDRHKHHRNGDHQDDARIPGHAMKTR